MYFDTPDFDLAAHQVLLERRADDWYLSSPDSPDGSIRIGTSVEHNGASLDVPTAVKDLLLAIVRNRALEQVGRSTTNRTVDTLYDGDDIALGTFTSEELAASIRGQDDRDLREWTVTLTAEGARQARLRKRLVKQIFDAGGVRSAGMSKLAPLLGPTRVPPNSVVKTGDSVHDAVAQQVERLLVWDRAVRADVEDSVHQMRVVTRTIRSLLQTARTSSRVDEDAWICDELQLLATILGKARDAEVLGQRYSHALDELPAEVIRGPVRQRLIDSARDEYEEGRQDSLRMMRSDRYLRLLAALETRTTAEPCAYSQHCEQPSNRRVLKAGYKRVRHRARRFADPDPQRRDEGLHAVRKSAKRLRYVAAATGSPNVSEAAATIQNLLGDHHDSVVSRTHLIRKANIAFAAAEDTFTYGLLHRSESEVARDCEMQLPNALDTLGGAVHTALNAPQTRHQPHRAT
ncbi:CYTH and CHAD domain-containing protein [soil metagenome]